MTGRLTIKVLPSGTEQQFDAGRPVVIGRDEAADVVVSYERASRRHVVVRPAGDAGWVVEDHSTNGTFSSGQRVTKLPINRPTVIQLGDPVLGVAVQLDPVAVGAVPAPSSPAGEPAPPPLTLGEFAAAHEPATRTRIGRADDNDIVIPDLLVSRYHAELRHSRGGFEIVDLGSGNGVFVDGVRVQRRARLQDGSLLSIGHHLFHLVGGVLQEYVDSGNVNFAAVDVGVRAGNRFLVQDVSFALDSMHFGAVLGPTGAGKSTLLRSLIGARPPDQGRVLYNGRDIYVNYDELRNRIGYVPQDDLLHPQLTVRRALEYAAALRFPPDVSARERSGRVEEIMAELGLSERADLVVAKLSGGQRKRTSVAIELLTRPSLLVLDEPTSGLDPGYERSVMELLRTLADSGRTVITVTHSVQSLERCDRILFLAPGGQTAYFGPPSEALPFFHLGDYAEVFQALDRAGPGRAHSAFSGSPPEDHYVHRPLADIRRALLQPAGPGSPAQPVRTASAAPRASKGNQFVTLLRRYLSVISNDRRNTALLLLQAPVLGVLMTAVLGHGNLNASHPASRAQAQTVLVALILGSIYLGASNSVREIVKERGIVTRELAVGASPAAYVLSKAVVLGALTVLQALVLVVLGVARQQGPGRGALLSSGRLELFVVVALTGISAMALGLLVSALVSNADKALTILPVILFAQFLMTGAGFNLQNTPVLGQLSYLTSARWGFSAAASTADLDAIQSLGCNGAPGRPGVIPGAGTCDPTHKHSGPVWIADDLALVGLTVVALGGAWRVIVPLGKPRRR